VVGAAISKSTVFQEFRQGRPNPASGRTMFSNLFECAPVTIGIVDNLVIETGYTKGHEVACRFHLHVRPEAPTKAVPFQESAEAVNPGVGILPRFAHSYRHVGLFPEIHKLLHDILRCVTPVSMERIDEG
jgi:hypothetical protein